MGCCGRVLKTTASRVSVFEKRRIGAGRLTVWGWCGSYEKRPISLLPRAKDLCPSPWDYMRLILEFPVFQDPSLCSQGLLRKDHNNTRKFVRSVLWTR